MVENLTIRAEAEIAADEIDTSDNVCINGIISIIWWCLDLNGDGKIEGPKPLHAQISRQGNITLK